ncbi:hypothetical protein DFJ73DRAFT_631798 [Zopfochytrium polystomum]|nr:hypothetical protein DFJ73DRAFT_631798 [Zopfochytrium polystomum]
MAMQMKGPNGYLPCRACDITGCKGGNENTLYVPLHRSEEHNQPKTFDPRQLPKRTHKRFLATAAKLKSAKSSAEKERISKATGIKGLSILTYCPGVKLPASFPVDFMHEMFENVFKLLYALWMGTFTGVSPNESSDNWKEIGRLTCETGNTIPSAFGARLGDLSNTKTTHTAEQWSFWFQYIAPTVLKPSLSAIHYQHLIHLIRLTRLCCKFTITAKDLNAIWNGFADWVTEYER